MQSFILKGYISSKEAVQMHSPLLATSGLMYFKLWVITDISRTFKCQCLVLFGHR